MLGARRTSTSAVLRNAAPRNLRGGLSAVALALPSLATPPLPGLPRTMRHLVLGPLAVALFASIAPSQIAAIGTHDVAWPNASGFGTPVLTARVHYPAVVAGFDAPPQLQPGGWPVVVFLHGYSLLGRDYGALGEALVGPGQVAVMLDTAQFSYVDMEHDARALLAAIAEANQSINSFLAGMFDLERVGLMGHSMGGAVAAFVLGDDPAHPLPAPGYRCALALSPVDPGAAVAAEVHVPFGIVGGEGDTLTPPAVNALPFYQALAPTAGVKFCYLMDGACGHMNVAGLDPSAPAVFDRALRIANGFFGQFFGTDVRGLEPVLGPDGESEAHLSTLLREVITPQVWAEAQLALGLTVRVSLLGNSSGIFGLVAASDLVTMPLPTWIGDLLVDPVTAFPLNLTMVSSDRLDISISVPDVTTVLGSVFALQGAGPGAASPFWLGSAIRLSVAD